MRKRFSAGLELAVVLHLLAQHRHDAGLDLLLRRDQRHDLRLPRVPRPQLQQGPRRLPRQAQLGLQLHVGDSLRARAATASAGKLLDGWQLAGIGQVRSGNPLTVFVAEQPLALAVVALARAPASASTARASRPASRTRRRARAARPVVRPDGLRPAARRARSATLGRGAFIGPNLRTFDLSAVKNTRVAAPRRGHRHPAPRRGVQPLQPRELRAARAHRLRGRGRQRAAALDLRAHPLDRHLLAADSARCASRYFSKVASPLVSSSGWIRRTSKRPAIPASVPDPGRARG